MAPNFLRALCRFSYGDGSKDSIIDTCSGKDKVDCLSVIAINESSDTRPSNLIMPCLLTWSTLIHSGTCQPLPTLPTWSESPSMVGTLCPTLQPSTWDTESLPWQDHWWDWGDIHLLPLYPSHCMLSIGLAWALEAIRSNIIWILHQKEKLSSSFWLMMNQKVFRFLHFLLHHKLQAVQYEKRLGQLADVQGCYILH